MKYLFIMCMLLIGCGEDVQFEAAASDVVGCEVTKVPQGTIINCGNGDVLIEDGAPGQDAVVLNKVNVPKNTCTPVSNDLWIENIQSGRVFDVYKNSTCQDSKGEYCDNVVPVDAATGKVDEYRGSGTVCWAGNKQISGVKQNNGDILIYMLEFN